MICPVSRVRRLLACAAFVLAAVAASCLPRPEGTSHQAETPGQEPTATAPLQTVPPTEGDTTSVVGGNAISMSSPRIQGNMATADVCYDFPGPGQWLLSGISLEVDTKPATMLLAKPFRTGDEPVNGTQRVTTNPGTEAEQQELRPASPMSKAFRCDTLTFATQPNVPEAAAFTLSIEALRYSPTEGQECEAYLTTVQTVLAAKAPGVRLACSQEDWGANVTIAEYPANMTPSQAEALLNDPSLFKVSGPWVFTGQFQ